MIITVVHYQRQIQGHSKDDEDEDDHHQDVHNDDGNGDDLH